VHHKKPLLYDNDLPESVLRRYLKQDVIAIDTETRGLIVHRDRLCLIQLCDAEGEVSLVRFSGSDAPNLCELLVAPTVLKLFHYARFDVAVMKHYLKVDIQPLWCTKIASKLIRTYTDRHSLKDLSLEMLGIEMDKTNQSSDWARQDLSESQMEYAANDVRYLIAIYKKMKQLLERENLTDLAQRCFDYLPTQAELDLRGYKDILEH